MTEGEDSELSNEQSTKPEWIQWRVQCGAAVVPNSTGDQRCRLKLSESEANFGVRFLYYTVYTVRVIQYSGYERLFRKL